MSIDWSNKEKIGLFSDILEFGDQPESWPMISNHLQKTFQTKKEGRYSIKVRIILTLQIFVSVFFLKNLNLEL